MMAPAYPVLSQDSGEKGEQHMRSDYGRSGENWQYHGMDGSLYQDRENRRVEPKKIGQMQYYGRDNGSHHMDDYHSSMGMGRHMGGYYGRHMMGYGSGGCN